MTADLACGRSVVVDLVADEPSMVSIAPSDQDRYLRVTELGVDVVLNGPTTTPREIAYPMTRHAWLTLPLEADRSLELTVGLYAAAFGQVSIAAHCDRIPESRLKWLQRADELAQQQRRGDQRPQLSPAFEDLLKTAPTAEDAAAATHMLADRYSLEGKSRQATQAYRDAEKQWRRLNRPMQVAGALIGVADVQMNTGNFALVDEVLAQAQQSLDPRHPAYLLIRARGMLCVKTQYLGNLEASIRCHQDIIKDWLAIGDHTEAVNSAISMSYALRDLGRPELGLATIDALMNDKSTSRVAPYVLTRLSTSRAYLRRDRGDLVGALAGFAEALRLAESATDGSSWQAHAITQIADIYAQLGVTDQAYRLLAESFALYDPASAPARVAAGLMKMGLIDRNSGNLQRAAQWYASAERIYALLNMPVERSEAALGALESRPPDNAEDARRELAQVRDWSRLSATLNSRRALLTVRWQIAAGDRAGAEAALKTIEAQPAPLPQRLLAARIRAELQHQQGADAAALRTIEQQLAEVGALANRAGNAAISYLTVRAARELREDWVRIALTAHPQPAPDRWWQVLVQSAPMQAVRPGRSVQGTDFGAALARELLGDGKANADRALVDALAPAESAPAVRGPSELPALAAVRAGLGEDWLLLVVPAEPSSAALWMGPERTVIVPLPSRSVLREEIAQLSTDLASPDVPMARLQRSVSALSASLLSGAPLSEAPARLHVLGDDLIGTIPFALLRWPGSERALIDTTATGWITRVDAGSPGAGSGAGLRVVVAPGSQQTSQVGLAPLRYAAAEPDLIARTVPELSQQRALDGEATPAALVQALGDPDAWVHLAAHGYAQTQLLGYAGAWLADPNNPQGSVMLSWLDVINTPLRAPLAVLNACQLAAGPSATSQSSLSFASAVSAAGVDHVVAAYWPISDSASATWIPAFYSAMRAQPAAHAMDALRSAQLALKDSRSFRHPYYWASLAYFQHLRVGR
ncbi:MAG: CHAT domain-containing protein [Lysobacterales bacterium]